MAGAGAGTAAAALAGVVAYARLIEPRRLEVPEVELTLPNWPARLDGLRVALIADLHAGGPHVDRHRVAAVTAAVRAAHPDLVLILGDLVDPHVPGGRRLPPDLVVRRLAPLRPPVGVVAVLGNHDWVHEGVTVGTVLRHAGITVLDNGAVRREARGGPLWIAGVGDLEQRDPRVGQALADVPEDEPVLLLTHQPDVFPAVPRRVALTVAGHLHGGQVNLPWLRRKALPSRHGTRYRAGHVVEGGRHLYVSKGIGEARLAVRLGVAPEAPVLVLRAG